MDERIGLKQRIKQSLDKYKEITKMFDIPLFSNNLGMGRFHNVIITETQIVKSAYEKHISLLFCKNDHAKINQFEQIIDYCQTDKEILEKCVSFYKNNDSNSLFCKFIQEIFVDINRGIIDLKNLTKSDVTENISKILGSGNFSIVQTNSAIPQPPNSQPALEAQIAAQQQQIAQMMQMMQMMMIQTITPNQNQLGIPQNNQAQHQNVTQTFSRNNPHFMFNNPSNHNPNLHQIPNQTTPTTQNNFSSQ